MQCKHLGYCQLIDLDDSQCAATIVQVECVFYGLQNPPEREFCAIFFCCSKKFYLEEDVGFDSCCK